MVLAGSRVVHGRLPLIPLLRAVLKPYELPAP
jgi:hypothetical protein